MTLRALILLLCISRISSQSTKRCDWAFPEFGTESGGVPTLGDPWSCESLTPIPLEVFGEFYPLPGAEEANPLRYSQVTGSNGTESADGSKVFAITGGSYICMLAESNGEAVLFDAPEAGFVSSYDGLLYPNGTWLTAAMEALLSEGTKLRYIVYTHRHWDHMGAAGLVAKHFAADNPTVISSRRTRLAIKKRDAKDPNTVYGNSRDVPVPVWYKDDVLKVGGLNFKLEKVHAHQAGDLMVTLDKNDEENARHGIESTVFMVTDTILPGWAPFYSLTIAQDVSDFLSALDEINGKDFDVLVGGHLTRLGTKADVQRLVDFFADVVAGAELAGGAIPFGSVVAATGIADPTNHNFGNTWLAFNEFFELLTDGCVAYVLDVPARGRDWLGELAGLDLTLRSQCWTIMNWAGIA